MSQPDAVIDLLEDLVAIDSVNPALVQGGAGEAAVAARLAQVCRRGGLDVQVQEAAPGRPNVIATVEGRAPGRTLMFCGHLDTVGVSGMDAPFSPVVRDGRLYGRGAQDMKGGVAAMVSAAITLGQRGALERGRVIVAAVADEEHASLGTEALVRDWRADAAIVTEPTDLQIGVAHKGFAEVEIETRGVAAHGSRPDLGRDAILRMGRVLGVLEQRERQFAASPAPARMGRPSLHASTIIGGREWSTYPDRCVLQVERRTVTGESGETALREIEALLAVLRDSDPEFEAAARLVFSRPPYEIDQSAEVAQALAAAVGAAGRAAGFTTMTFWTDAALLGGAGIPSVLFGPGGAGLHGIEEYVKLDEVVACRDILVGLAIRYC